MENFNRLTDAPTLRETVDRLIQENVVRPIRGIATPAQGWFPVDVVDQDDQLEVLASLPGINPDQLDVSLQGDTLTIRGEHTVSSDHGSWLVRERPTGSFNRVLNLPFRVDPDRVETSFDHGVLTLRFHKAGAAPTRRIPIGSSRSTVPTAASVFEATGVPRSPATNLETDVDDNPATWHLPSGTEPRAPDEDKVTEASVDSFPASDPPAWGGSHRV